MTFSSKNFDMWVDVNMARPATKAIDEVREELGERVKMARAIGMSETEILQLRVEFLEDNLFQVLRQLYQ